MFNFAVCCKCLTPLNNVQFVMQSLWCCRVSLVTFLFCCWDRGTLWVMCLRSFLTYLLTYFGGDGAWLTVACALVTGHDWVSEARSDQVDWCLKLLSATAADADWWHFRDTCQLTGVYKVSYRCCTCHTWEPKDLVFDEKLTEWRQEASCCKDSRPYCSKADYLA